MVAVNVPNQPKQPRRRVSAGVTVADVARAAGVSAMTVSRVTNCDAGVATSTREKVEQAIAALGYIPNPAARSLAGARQTRIALIHANPSSAYLSEVLMGCLAQATASDAMIVVEQHDPPEETRDLVARLRKHRIDAVLLPPPLCDDAGVIAALDAEGLALARIATGAPATAGHAVTIDDRAAACAMITRLIGLGHRRIGFIAGHPNQTASALRRAGYEAALVQAGIMLDPELVAQGDFTYRSGLVAAGHLLSLPHRPTALFASNDDMAAASVSAAHRLGLEVPRDLSVAGFDDTAMATATWPELTTVRQPVAAMARSAVRLLVESLRRGAAIQPQHERLDYDLILRGSDGPVPITR